MKKFDAKITDIEEGLLKNIGKGVKNTIVNPVKNTLKTGLTVGKGIGNTALGAATLDKDRVSRGLDQSVGTVARGVGGTIKNTADNVAALPKNLSQGKLVAAAGNIANVATSANPVVLGKRFARNASQQQPQTQPSKPEAIASTNRRKSRVAS